MKINIIFNSFKPNHSQKIALDSWLWLQQNGYVDTIYDAQFPGEHNHNNVVTLDKLSRSSLDLVDDGTKKLPVVRDIFELGASQCDPDDYFIFTNNDVIINKNLIEHIRDAKPGTMACSRLNIKNIDNFQQFLDRDITPTNYEIVGYDVFIFRCKWWHQHSSIFRDYLLGQPVWDNVFVAFTKLFGGNHPLGNGLPPYCFHIEHAPTWQSNKQAPEQLWNKRLCKRSHLDRLCFNIYGVFGDQLVYRKPPGLYTNPIENERQYEYNFWDKFYSHNLALVEDLQDKGITHLPYDKNGKIMVDKIVVND